MTTVVTFSFIDANLVDRFCVKIPKRKRSPVIAKLISEVVKGNIIINFENDEITIKYSVKVV